MKKRLLSIIVVFILGISIIKAQNPDHRIAIGVNAGFSLAGTIVKIAEDADPTASFNSSISPAIQGTFDFSLLRVLSLGVSFSTQSIDLEVTDPSATVQNFDVNVDKMNIGIRPLLHYANRGRVDLYSGLRIGYKMNKSTSTSPSYDLSTWDPIIPYSFQVIPFGMRVYVTKNIGLGAEFGIGAPHYASVGLSVRL